MQEIQTDNAQGFFKDVGRLLLIREFSPPSDLMPFPLDDSVLLALCVSLVFFDSDETCVLILHVSMTAETRPQPMNELLRGVATKEQTIVRGQDVHSQTTVLCK